MPDLTQLFRQSSSTATPRMLPASANSPRRSTNAQFWQKPFPYGNSFGHLVLHLTGNLNYYIGAQIAQTGYVRDRPREFNDPNPPSKEEALKRFDDAVAMVQQTIRAQSPEDWSAEYSGAGTNAQNSPRHDPAVRRPHAAPHRPDDLSRLRMEADGDRSGISTRKRKLVFLCVLWCCLRGEMSPGFKLPVQLRESSTSAIARLTADHVPSPRLNAELLLMFTLNCDRAYLFAHPERELTADEQCRYESALAERTRGIPAQYITGHQEFWGMDLIVTPAVLIPRPETEHVIEAVLELAAVAGARTGRQCDGPDDEPEPKHNSASLDIGTGSGAIALALAKEFPQAEIHATDISAAALEIARANAARHQLDAPHPISSRPTCWKVSTSAFDFIVSNPPYVGESEEDQVQLEVRKFEPRNAVFAGANGTGSDRTADPAGPCGAQTRRLAHHGNQRNDRGRSTENF